MLHKPTVFTTHLQASSIEMKTHENKPYVVAPCVALVPGVLNGDLVPLPVVTATYRAWNGRPVVVGHPLDSDGQSISANSLPVLETYGIGHIWNADIDANRLRVEVWVDQEKAERLGGDALKIIERLNAGDSIEVSTGYWANLHVQDGEYNGKAYNMVTELIVPDHLAILPNDVGACNWGDGCGIPRNMQEYTMPKTNVDEILTLIRGLKADMAQQQRTHCQTCNQVITHTEEEETPMPEEEEVPEQTPSHEEEEQEKEEEMPQPVNPGGDPNLDPEDVGQPVQQRATDTLSAFLAQHRINKGALTAIIKARVAERKNQMAVVKANTELTDDDLISMTDKALALLAAQYESSNPEVYANIPTVYAGLGLPVSQQTDKAQMPKPVSVLLKKVG